MKVLCTFLLASVVLFASFFAISNSSASVDWSGTSLIQDIIDVCEDYEPFPSFPDFSGNNASGTADDDESFWNKCGQFFTYVGQFFVWLFNVVKWFIEQIVFVFRLVGCLIPNVTMEVSP